MKAQVGLRGNHLELPLGYVKYSDQVSELSPAYVAQHLRSGGILG